MNICVIGTGYVGLVTGTCLADLGNQVICVDNNQDKIKMLKKGKMPIYEPGLAELVAKNTKEKRLEFTTKIKEGVGQSQIIFISVNTPRKEDGEPDLSYVEKVTAEIAAHMKDYKIIVEKSTVPVETGEKIIQTIKLHNPHKTDFDVVSNPEFLREGSAIEDTMHPDRIVLGVSSKRAEKIMRDLYRPLKAPIIVTDIKSAEIIKHASNSFLAMKISFANAVANICDRVGADVEKVAEGMGYDKRIGRAFLNAGVGFGGSCFPKDLAAFIYIAKKSGYDFELLKAVQKINEQQKKILLQKIEESLWVLKNKTIGILGLAFKPETDDLRSAPAIDIIRSLQAAGAKIKAYDPIAMGKARKVLSGVKYGHNAYEVARGSDMLVIITEWNEFKQLDLERVKKLLRTPIIVDGRNIYDPVKMKELGYTYKCIGRK